MTSITLWHGGRDLESGYTDFPNHRTGKWEHGAGLYLTARRQTAEKYAKGGKKMYRVTVDLERNIEDVNFGDEELEDFIAKFVTGTKRKEFRAYVEQGKKRRNIGRVPAIMLSNLALNLEAVTSSKTGAMRKWFVDHGVGYIHVPNYGGWEGGDVYVIVDPKLIKKVERASSLSEDAPADPLMSKVKAFYKEHLLDAGDHFDPKVYHETVEMLKKRTTIFDARCRVWRAEIRPIGDAYHTVGGFWTWHGDSAAVVDRENAEEYHGLGSDQMEEIVFEGMVDQSAINIIETIAKNMVLANEKEVSLHNDATVNITGIYRGSKFQSMNIKANVLRLSDF